MQKGLLYNMLLRLGKCFFLFPLFFIACDDLEDKPSIVPESNGDVFETGTAEMYILSEGLFNQNNSSLARYSFNRQRCTNNYFSANNQRGLGDTANDIAIYGNKIYVVVNVSSTVEVIDFPTGKSIRQISMLRDNGSSRQPRAIAFDKDKAYICSYDAQSQGLTPLLWRSKRLSQSEEMRKISAYKTGNCMYPIPADWIIRDRA